MRGHRRFRESEITAPLAGSDEDASSRTGRPTPTPATVDATITIDHSDRKENAAATWKRTSGFHPLLVFLDRPDIAGGEALAAMLRAGNADSNTTADHIQVLGEALLSLPETYRPRPGDPDSPRVLIRSDSAGATHGFAAACA